MKPLQVTQEAKDFLARHGYTLTVKPELCGG